VLRPEPGREEEAQFWLASLSVNRAIMRAIEAIEPCPQVRHQPHAEGRRHDRKPDETRRY
jgi:hypothetical protein